MNEDNKPEEVVETVEETVPESTEAVEPEAA
jgi:hypothetical protein